MAVLSGVANVVFGRVGDFGKLFPKSFDHDVRVIDAECRLGEVGDLVCVGNAQSINVLGRLNENDLVGCFAHRPDHFIMALVANQDDGIPLLGVFDGFEVNLDDKRARRVDRAEFTCPRLVSDLGGNAVGAIKQSGTVGNLIHGFDEDRPPARKRSTTNLLWTIS